MSDAQGGWIECSECGGCGLISVYSATDFEGADECRECSGGRLWRYASGVIALYPGGPLRGRTTLAAAPTTERSDA